MNRFLPQEAMLAAPRGSCLTGRPAQVGYLSPAARVAEQALGSTTAPNDDSKTQEGEHYMAGRKEPASCQYKEGHSKNTDANEKDN